MDKRKAAQIINDYHASGVSYRNLGKKYGESYSTIYRMISKKRAKDRQEEVFSRIQEEVLADDIVALKEALRQAKLKIELQDLMIDIASKELGVDIRKKSGTRRS